MKDLKITLLLITIIVILLWFGKKENFTQDANIDTFLNTWQLTNKEISNTMELSDDKITFKKPIKTNSIIGDDLTVKKLNINYENGKKTQFGSGGVHDFNEINGTLKVSGKITGTDAVYANRLCVGDTCINENHLKVLTGGKGFSIKSDLNQTRLENYKKDGGFWNTADENAQKMRIHAIRD